MSFPKLRVMQTQGALNFQVVAQLLTAEGTSAATASRPGLVPHYWVLHRWVRCGSISSCSPQKERNFFCKQTACHPACWHTIPTRQ